MTPHRTLLGPPDERDPQLVAAAVAGDDHAFSALADRHRPLLHAHCRRILGSAPDAEDAVQEALLRAWRRRGSFEGRSSFRWWLLRIATNACMDIARRGTRSPAVWRRLDGDDPGRDPPAEEASTDPAALVTASEAVEHAYLVAIRILPARQRAVLVLRDVLRFSAADTAELLGDTVPSVNSALQRARVALARRQRLTPTTTPAPPVTPAEHDVMRRLVEAHDRADVAAIVATLKPAEGRRRGRNAGRSSAELPGVVGDRRAAGTAIAGTLRGPRAGQTRSTTLEPRSSID